MIKLKLKKQLLKKARIRGRKPAGIITFLIVEGEYLVKMVIKAQIDMPTRIRLMIKNNKWVGFFLRLVTRLFTSVAGWGLLIYL